MRQGQAQHHADAVTDLHELLGTLPTDCALIAAHAYLTRYLRSTRQPANPTKATTTLARDARRLIAALHSWDGELQHLLPALAAAVEAVAEGVGAAADIAVRHAQDPAHTDDLAEHWGRLADQTVGAYDAIVGAANLLAPSALHA